MSKERLDIAIGILDNTENAIEKIKNQHKFEKDLSEFLNTNTYSKDKYWVVGMLNQVSEYCKDKIDTLMENQQLKQSVEYTNRQLDYFTNKFRSREFKRTGDWMKDIELYMKQLAINELERLLNECESEIYYTNNNDFEHFNELISEETVDAIPEEKLEEYIEKRIKELKGEK